MRSLPTSPAPHQIPNSVHNVLPLTISLVICHMWDTISATFLSNITSVPLTVCTISGFHLTIYGIWISIFVTFSVTLQFKTQLASCNGWRKPENLAKTIALPKVIGNFPTCSGWDLNLDSGERQLAVSGNALDQKAIRAGPWPSLVICHMWYAGSTKFLSNITSVHLAVCTISGLYLTINGEIVIDEPWFFQSPVPHYFT